MQSYVFQFGPILIRSEELIHGAWLTVWFAATSMVLGLAIGLLGAVARSFGPRWLSAVVATYVELIRNTPLLIQLYFVFFTLPFLGLKLSSSQAAILALSIHLGAYATEILRAGIQSIPAGQIEAAKSLGLRPIQIIRRVVLLQALRAVYPALCGQFILQLLGTSIISAIAAEELTAIANNMVMQTFRSFEVYIAVAIIYFVLVQAFGLLFQGFSRIFFRWKI
ncbi:amino acid ABC transporter permease [Kaistia nematophila]|uniref:Amino acid ABC transporter permease n=1 Tax=Kaistia nematophila TaxID=2994654 RepID=A0A9X3E5Q3_9HYPH|nr:amino acid ABC transporter permease [Kaistia nematophila]MCX5571613.1 amino acid ABC transporter permease [Kaistia nematophila]